MEPNGPLVTVKKPGKFKSASLWCGPRKTKITRINKRLISTLLEHTAAAAVCALIIGENLPPFELNKVHDIWHGVHHTDNHANNTHSAIDIIGVIDTF